MSNCKVLLRKPNIQDGAMYNFEEICHAVHYFLKYAGWDYVQVWRNMYRCTLLLLKAKTDSQTSKLTKNTGWGYSHTCRNLQHCVLIIISHDDAEIMRLRAIADMFNAVHILMKTHKEEEICSTAVLGTCSSPPTWMRLSTVRKWCGTQYITSFESTRYEAMYNPADICSTAYLISH